MSIYRTTLSLLKEDHVKNVRFFCGICWKSRGFNHKRIDTKVVRVSGKQFFSSFMTTSRTYFPPNLLYKHLRQTHKLNHSSSAMIVFRLLLKKFPNSLIITTQIVMADKNMEQKGYGLYLIKGVK